MGKMRQMQFWICFCCSWAKVTNIGPARLWVSKHRLNLSRFNRLAHVSLYVCTWMSGLMMRGGVGEREREKGRKRRKWERGKAGPLEQNEHTSKFDPLELELEVEIIIKARRGRERERERIEEEAKEDRWLMQVATGGQALTQCIICFSCA